MFDASGWLAIDPYHFHPHINSAAIVHYQNAFYHIGGEIKDSPFQSNVIAKLDLVNFKWSQVGVLTHDRRRLLIRLFFYYFFSGSVTGQSYPMVLFSLLAALEKSKRICPLKSARFRIQWNVSIRHQISSSIINFPSCSMFPMIFVNKKNK